MTSGKNSSLGLPDSSIAVGVALGAPRHMGLECGCTGRQSSPCRRLTPVPVETLMTPRSRSATEARREDRDTKIQELKDDSRFPATGRVGDSPKSAFESESTMIDWLDQQIKRVEHRREVCEFQRAHLGNLKRLVADSHEVASGGNTSAPGSCNARQSPFTQLDMRLASATPRGSASATADSPQLQLQCLSARNIARLGSFPKWATTSTASRGSNTSRMHEMEAELAERSTQIIDNQSGPTSVAHHGLHGVRVKEQQLLGHTEGFETQSSTDRHARENTFLRGLVARLEERLSQSMDLEATNLRLQAACNHAKSEFEVATSEHVHSECLQEKARQHFEGSVAELQGRLHEALDQNRRYEAEYRILQAKQAGLESQFGQLRHAMACAASVDREGVLEAEVAEARGSAQEALNRSEVARLELLRIRDIHRLREETLEASVEGLQTRLQLAADRQTPQHEVAQGKLQRTIANLEQQLQVQHELVASLREELATSSNATPRVRLPQPEIRQPQQVGQTPIQPTHGLPQEHPWPQKQPLFPSSPLHHGTHNRQQQVPQSQLQNLAPPVSQMCSQTEHEARLLAIRSESVRSALRSEGRRHDAQRRDAAAGRGSGLGGQAAMRIEADDVALAAGRSVALPQEQPTPHRELGAASLLHLSSMATAATAPSGLSNSASGAEAGSPCFGFAPAPLSALASSGTCFEPTEDTCPSQTPIYLSESREGGFLAVPQQVIDAVEQLRECSWTEMHWRCGFTLLHWAAKNDMPELCTYAMSLGGDADDKDDAGLSPIEYAQQAQPPCSRALTVLLKGPPRIAVCSPRLMPLPRA